MSTLMATLRKTHSVCPICLEQVSATLERRGSSVYLVKKCPDHGEFTCLVWEGEPALEDWTSSRFPLSSPEDAPPRDCPGGCGLCPDHRQKSCAVLIEVTERCQLKCPVCFADAGSPVEPDFKFICGLLKKASEKAPRSILQVSGGEPTLREDLPGLLRLASGLDFTGIQLNTNGLRIAEEPGYAEKLKEAGLGWVFLQFDGLRESTHLSLRGRPLRAVKEEAVRSCGKAGLGVVLVPTLAGGVNDGEMGDIVRFGLEWFPVVRGVHFQPMSYFGRYPEPPEDRKRLTLPRLMRNLEEQTRGMIQVSHFKPSRCEHERCSFRAVYLVEDKDRIIPIANESCRCDRTPDEGFRSSIESVRRRWGADITGEDPKEQPGMGIEEVFERFIRLHRRGSFSVSAMAFQDAENLDLERLRFCCIHVAAPDGDLVPFCAWNLTSRDGKSLHRRR